MLGSEHSHRSTPSAVDFDSSLSGIEASASAPSNADSCAGRQALQSLSRFLDTSFDAELVLSADSEPAKHINNQAAISDSRSSERAVGDPQDL